jgi:putative Holliday junction resolvase
VIGLDVGNVRIGVAVSDPLGYTAQAREVWKSVSPEADIAHVRDLVLEMKAVRVVVGLPLNQSGESGEQAQRVTAFAERLRDAVDIPVELIDERFTTAMAERGLIEANMRRDKRKKVVDMVAAQHILQTWMDRSAREQRENRA